MIMDCFSDFVGVLQSTEIVQPNYFVVTTVFLMTHTWQTHVTLTYLRGARPGTATNQYFYA